MQSFVTPGYTAAATQAALATHRYEIFRHELHRIVAGSWQVVADLTPKVRSATLHYDRWGRTYMRSGTYELYDDGTTINFRTDAVRTFWRVRMPDGNFAEWMMGTFYLNSPVVPLTVPLVRTVEAYDALIALEQSKITDWFTVPTANLTGGYDAGDPVGWAITLIGDRYPLAGVDIPATTARITQPKTYPPGTSILDICNDLLLFANYEQLWANVTGSFISHPFVQPSQRAVEFTYADGATSVLVKETGRATEDTFNAPNQWLRIVSRPDRSVLRSRYTLDDPANPISTTYRGRTVTDYAAVDVADQATLDALVKRLAEEGQRVVRQLEVETPLMPHDHQDKVTVSYANHAWNGAASGTYLVRRWSFPCVAGGKMQHQMELAPMTAVL